VPYRIAFISLGCAKNQIDCELMLCRTEGAGFEITRRLEDADAIVVNTCSFIAPAIEEADSQIREALRYKERGRCRAVVVAGCLPQYLQQKRFEQYPQVDGWLTPDTPGDAGELLLALLDPAGHERTAAQVQPGATAGAGELPIPRFLASAADGRVLSTPPSYAYVKIAEGCDHRCCFCIIPHLRGPYRSRPLSDIVEEVRGLVERGTPEIILVSQDCTYYGRDCNGPRLIDLLAAICEIPGDFWLRVLYLYPLGFPDEELRAWAQLGPKLLPYFDIPIQHVSPTILQSMQRGNVNEHIDTLLARIRSQMPDAVIRTSLIAGFPGETEADFQQLLDWVQSGAADRVGVFAYSDLPEMPSHQLAGHVLESEAQQRCRLLMSAHHSAHERIAQRMVDRVLEAVVESRRRQAGGRRWLNIARTWREAPGIDGIVAIPSDRELPLFRRVRVRITGVKGVDLAGIPL
jgi:ribosomal protein S12 methylthiotransferase